MCGALYYVDRAHSTAEVALSHLRAGGIYVLGELRPQSNGPDGEAERVRALIADLDWASGVTIVVNGD